MADEPTDVVVKADDTKWGIGFKLKIGAHEFELEPGEFGESDFRKGSFHAKLPKDETRDIGTFKTFWDEISTTIVELPDLAEYQLPDPLDNLVDAHVILLEFDLEVVAKVLKHFLLDVELAVKWKVPGLKAVEVESLRVRIDHTPTPAPAA